MIWDYKLAHIPLTQLQALWLSEPLDLHPYLETLGEPNGIAPACIKLCLKNICPPTLISCLKRSETSFGIPSQCLISFVYRLI